MGNNVNNSKIGLFNVCHNTPKTIKVCLKRTSNNRVWGTIKIIIYLNNWKKILIVTRKVSLKLHS